MPAPAPRETHWVRPVLPTVLKDQQELLLTAASACVNDYVGSLFLPLGDELTLEVVQISYSISVGGTLDRERFKTAVARTLSVWPHHASRLSLCPRRGQWRFLLKNEALPITFLETDVLGIFDDNFDYEKHPDYYDPVRLEDFQARDVNDAPPVKLLVTYCRPQQSTAILLSQHHVIGDAYSVQRFLRDLSHIYQGQEPVFAPTFEQYGPEVLDRSCEPDVALTGIRYLSSLATNYPARGMQKMEARLNPISTARVDLTFSADEVESIRKKILGRDSPASASGNAVTAYVATVLQSVMPHPFLHFMKLIGTRGTTALTPAGETPYPALTAPGNGFVIVGRALEPLHGLAAARQFAQTSHRLTTELRDPKLFGPVIQLNNHIWRQARYGGRVPWEWPLDCSVQTNNIAPLEFGRAHFGYPGTARTHDWETWLHFIELLEPNPVRRADGTWDARRGSLRVILRVHGHVKARFLRLVARGVDALADGPSAAGAEGLVGNSRL